MVSKMFDCIFSIACKTIVLVLAIAYILDKAININLFKIF